MKIQSSNRRDYAITLPEVVVVIAVVLVLAAILLPTLTRPRYHSRINCVNNLKQIGLGFRIWAADNNDKYPQEVSATNGGALEFASAGNAAVAFQVMSNELSTPKILVCPMDQEHAYATNFTSDFSAKHISYFVGMDANESDPQALLSGDDNFQFGGNLIKSGLRVISTNVFYTWTTNRHNMAGNVVFADGSVQSLSNQSLTNQIRQTNFSILRIIIP